MVRFRSGWATIALATTALVAGRWATAQQSNPEITPTPAPVTQPAVPPAPEFVGGGGGWGGGWGNHASTAAEGFQRGAADVIRSTGYTNLMNSAAAQNWEQARSMELDNNLKTTQTFFTMRAVNTEARRQENGPNPTQEQLFRMARDAAPNRLNAVQLDRASGSINWPMVLTDAQYSPQTQALERDFATRAQEGGRIDTTTWRSINTNTQTLLDKLRANISQYPANAFMDALNFVNSLRLEVNSPSA